ncbi:MAG: hypothetical protein RSC76_08925, partial [Oscillospiraceae bacterium]
NIYNQLNIDTSRTPVAVANIAASAEHSQKTFGISLFEFLLWLWFTVSVQGESNTEWLRLRPFGSSSAGK